MKIGIYARGLSTKSGGVKQYIYSLTKAMIQVIDKHELFIMHNLNKKIFDCSKTNTNEILINSSNKMICDYILAPRLINSLKLDCCLFPKNVIPYGINCKKIVTIHDLAYYLPEYNAYPIIDTLYMKKMIKSSCNRADHIIAVSKNTKKDLNTILKIPEWKISVVYEAADSKFKVIKDKIELNSIKKKYDLPDKFILFTGGISPRKNIIRLIESFNKVSQKYEEEIYLVLTGSKSWKDSKEQNLIDENKFVKKIGFVEDEDMSGLYNLAELYVYPSLYEGFGLPLLEAQACGCPVLTSNVASCPEVAGEGAHIVDPYSIKDIKRWMLKILKNEEYKDQLIKKGFENLERFCWEKSAKQLLKVTENV